MEKNIRLLYSALGAFMLMLLRSDIGQGTIGIFNELGLYYIAEIAFLASKILSLIGIIIFIICSIKLILNNFKFKM